MESPESTWMPCAHAYLTSYTLNAYPLGISIVNFKSDGSSWEQTHTIAEILDPSCQRDIRPRLSHCQPEGDGHRGKRAQGGDCLADDTDNSPVVA